jgi:hypothetical protein
MSRERQPDLSPSHAACEWLIEALPQDSLYETVRSLGGEAGQLLPGFSVSHKAMGRRSVRKLLARSLASHPRFAGRICLAPRAPWQPWGEALPVLDETWLKQHWRELARHYGPPFGVAMALDERDAVRRRGDRLLQRTAFWQDDCPRARELPTGWRKLVELVGTAEPKSEHDSTDAARRIRELEQQCQQLRDTLARWKQRLKEAETGTAEQADKHRQEQRELRHQLRAKENEIAAIQDGFDVRLRQHAEAFRNRLLGAPPDLPADDTADLIRRAENALERQKTMDERRGTRPRLQAELERLEALEKNLQRCLAESVVLVPDLNETAMQVGQRLREIRELLGDMDADTEAPDLAAALLYRLKNAHLGDDADEELARLRAMLDLDIVREVLGPKMHARLTNLEHTRRELAKDALLDLQAGATPEAETATGNQEVWDLAERLHDEPPASVWLFIDGYNAIRRVPDLHRLEQEKGMAAARDRFCALCRRCAHQFGHVEIVFDGIESTAATESCAGVRIVYSRSASDSQNADEHLVRRLHSVRDRCSTIWLVTDDFGLRERVADCCDAFVPPALFQRFLTSTD